MSFQVYYWGQWLEIALYKQRLRHQNEEGANLTNTSVVPWQHIPVNYSFAMKGNCQVGLYLALNLSITQSAYLLKPLTQLKWRKALALQQLSLTAQAKL